MKIHTLKGTTELKGTEGEVGFTANLVLHLLRLGWHSCLLEQGEIKLDGHAGNGYVSERFEELCDGFGAGNGSLDDWSGIRDSSHEAKKEMLEVMLNALGKLLDPEGGAS